jgi:hypothetical protein
MVAQIFTRYDMFKMLIINYDYTGNDDWLEMEDYLSKIYDCDCTDCGGGDVSRACNVEKVFSKKYGRISRHNML